MGDGDGYGSQWDRTDGQPGSETGMGATGYGVVGMVVLGVVCRDVSHHSIEDELVLPFLHLMRLMLGKMLAENYGIGVICVGSWSDGGGLIGGGGGSDGGVG